MNIDIANRLFELRKKNSLSQEDLAEKIGVSRQAVSKWERAEASPDTDNLILLAKLYEISLDELLSTDEPVAPTSKMERDAGGDFSDGYSERYQSGRIEEYDEEEGEQSRWLAFPYPLIVVVIYLLLGFTFDLWHPAWILFLTIPIYYSYFGYDRRRRYKKR